LVRENLELKISKFLPPPEMPKVPKQNAKT
jgi:hypothetical protein